MCIRMYTYTYTPETPLAIPSEAPISIFIIYICIWASWYIYTYICIYLTYGRAHWCGAPMQNSYACVRWNFVLCSISNHIRFFPSRYLDIYCVCTVCAGTKKILKPFRSHLLDTHPSPCNCPCDSCSSGACRPPAVDLFWVQEHLLCSKSQLLDGSDRNYYPWKCLQLQCNDCFLHKPSVLLCDQSAFTDLTTYWNGRNGKLRITLNETWLLLRTCYFFQRRQFLILASLYDTYQRHPN